MWRISRMFGEYSFLNKGLTAVCQDRGRAPGRGKRRGAETTWGPESRIGAAEALVIAEREVQ